MNQIECSLCKPFSQKMVPQLEILSCWFTNKTKYPFFLESIEHQRRTLISFKIKIIYLISNLILSMMMTEWLNWFKWLISPTHINWFHCETQTCGAEPQTIKSRFKNTCAIGVHETDIMQFNFWPAEGDKSPSMKSSSSMTEAW